MLEIDSVLRKKLVVHHSSQLTSVLTTCGTTTPIDYLIDRHATVVTNYDSVWAHRSDQGNDSETITLCLEGDYEQNPLGANVNQGAMNFIKHLSRVAAIAPRDIIAHRECVHESDPAVPELCPGIYVSERLASIRAELEAMGEELHRTPEYDAVLDIRGVAESSDGFEVVGWVTNVGSAPWYVRQEEWDVSLGLKAFAPDQSLLIEQRYPIASGGVAPGEGFAFQLAVGVPYASCARLQVGLVIENKLWFSNSGLQPLTFDGPLAGSIVLPTAEAELQKESVAVAALTGEEESVDADGWIRQGLWLDPSLVRSDKKRRDWNNARRAAVEMCNSVIAECGDRDVVIVSRGAQFQDPTWLAKLRRSAYAEPTIAAAGAIVADEHSRVLDIGGALLSTGYTRSPGFLKGIRDREVVMHREPGFLPVGAIYIRRDALRRVGPLNPEWCDLQMAMIEWCYRARPCGMKMRIEHSAVAIVPAFCIAAASRSPISGYSRRQELLQRLSGIVVEGRYA